MWLGRLAGLADIGYTEQGKLLRVLSGEAIELAIAARVATAASVNATDKTEILA
jgi:hypothetical protein